MAGLRVGLLSNLQCPVLFQLGPWTANSQSSTWFLFKIRNCPAFISGSSKPTGSPTHLNFLGSLCGLPFFLFQGREHMPMSSYGCLCVKTCVFWQYPIWNWASGSDVTVGEEHALLLTSLPWDPFQPFLDLVSQDRTEQTQGQKCPGKTRGASGSCCVAPSNPGGPCPWPYPGYPRQEGWAMTQFRKHPHTSDANHGGDADWRPPSNPSPCY